jgi:hypothetical protein
VRPVAEESHPIEALLLASNPRLHAIIEARREAADLARLELDAYRPLRRGGGCWKLAMMQLLEIPRDPESERLAARLERFDAMLLHQQRELMAEVDRHVKQVRRLRRAQAFLHLMARTRPTRLSPLRVALPIFVILGHLVLGGLVLGDVRISPWLVGALVFGGAVVLPALSAVFYGSRLRSWYLGTFVPLAQERGLDLRVLFELLARAERGADAEIAELARQRHVLAEIITGYGAMIAPSAPDSLAA